MQITPINTTNNNFNKTKRSNNFKAKMIVKSVSNYYSPISSIETAYKKLSVGEKKDIVQLVEKLYNMAKDKEIYAYFPDYFYICPANTYTNYIKSKGPINVDKEVMINLANMCWSRDSWDLKMLFNQIKDILKKYDKNPSDTVNDNIKIPEKLTDHEFFIK